ncbi:MAG TPA: hypothetical protein VIT91_14345 [Chthoniobacterales bacterium]
MAGESDQTIQALISQIVERSVGRLEEEDRKERDPARATAENRIADPENDADVESPEEGKSDSDSVEPDDVPGERVEDFADVAEPEASPEEEGLTFENSAVTVESMGVASLAVDSNESSEILETSETAGINPVVGKAQLNLF